MHHAGSCCMVHCMPFQHARAQKCVCVCVCLCVSVQDTIPAERGSGGSGPHTDTSPRKRASLVTYRAGGLNTSEQTRGGSNFLGRVGVGVAHTHTCRHTETHTHTHMVATCTGVPCVLRGTRMKPQACVCVCVCVCVSHAGRTHGSCGPRSPEGHLNQRTGRMTHTHTHTNTNTHTGE